MKSSILHLIIEIGVEVLIFKLLAFDIIVRDPTLKLLALDIYMSAIRWMIFYPASLVMNVTSMKLKIDTLLLLKSNLCNTMVLNIEKEVVLILSLVHIGLLTSNFWFSGHDTILIIYNTNRLI